MGLIFGLVAIVLGLVSIACWIATLVKMFQASVLQGIIGLICGLWAFIWGWQHKGEDYLGKVMPIWTIAFIGGIIVNVLSTVMAAHH